MVRSSKEGYLSSSHFPRKSKRNTSLVPRKRLAFKSKVRVNGSEFERRLFILKSLPDKVDAKYSAGVSKEAKAWLEYEPKSGRSREVVNLTKR